MLNNNDLKDKAIVSTLENPNDPQAQNILLEIEDRIRSSALFVCRVSEDMAEKHLEFEIAGMYERKLKRIPWKRIQTVLMAHPVNQARNADRDLLFDVPIDFVPMRRAQVDLVLGGSTIRGVELQVPDYETALNECLQIFERERASSWSLNSLNCKYLTHITRL
jgi:hypothetical protein